MHQTSLTSSVTDCMPASENDDQYTPAFKHMYKAQGSTKSQEDRRSKLLEQQKKRREQTFNAGRQLELSDSEDDLELMECTTTKNKDKKFHKYGNKLMHSEWMLEVPNDLEEKWYFVTCPAGKRCIVVARNGSTSAYSSHGKKLATFQSLLPGGSRFNNKKSSPRFAMLDCVWCYKSSTYYILDVLAWGNQSFQDCETEFRFFWLSTQLSEIEGISETSPSNKFCFASLPFHPCTSGDLDEVMTGTPAFSEVMDGVLFYHREGHYTAGRSPLVVWLLPFMLPEVLGVAVAEPLAAQQPANYPGHQEFVHHFQAQNRKERRQDYRDRKEASRSVLHNNSSIDMHEDGSGEDESLEEG